MLRFAHAGFLWGLLIIPLLALLFIVVSRWKKKAMAHFGDQLLVQRLVPGASSSAPVWRFLLFAIACTFVIIGIADPQIGSKMEEVKRKQADLMILLDVSNSMLAQDLAPDRLEHAKMAIAQMITNLHNDRIGIIVFAGQAYVQLPVTTDYSAAKLFLNTINTNMVPTQGTAIGAAIELGLKSFDFKNGTGKAMILLTDGENHEDDAVAAAKEAVDKGVSVHVIGVGSPEGAPLPAAENTGGTNGAYRTDSLGHPIISKLNEDMAKEIAAAGNGTYIRANATGSGLDIVMNEIDKMQRKTVDSKSFKDFEDRFQLFLGAAFLLLIAEMLISGRKNPVWSRYKLFDATDK